LGWPVYVGSLPASSEFAYLPTTSIHNTDFSLIVHRLGFAVCAASAARAHTGSYSIVKWDHFTKKNILNLKLEDI